MPRYRVFEEESSINNSTNSSIPTTSSSKYEQLTSSSPVIGPQDIEFVSSHIEYLYVHNKLPGLLYFVSNLSTRLLSELPTDKKIILAKSLFKMGRTESAKRRLCALIEQESDLDSRRDLLWIMLKWCKIMDWKETSSACIGDLIYLKSVEALQQDNNDDFSNNINISEEFLKEILEKVQRLTTKDLAEYHFTSKSFATQVKELISSGCALPHKSLGNLCYNALSFVNRSIGMLKKGGFKQNSLILHEENDPLCSIFQLITYYPSVPLHLYTDILKYSETIKKCINEQRQEHLPLDTCYLASNVIEFLSLPSNIKNSSFCLSEMISRHRFILGFLSLAQNEAENAILHFRWLFEFLTDLGNRFRNNIASHKYLGIRAYIICHALLCELVLRSQTDIPLDDYQSWCLQLLQNSEMVYETHTTYFEGNIGPHLNAYAGFCCERRAYLMSESVTLVYPNDVSRYAKKLQFNELFAAATNYLIAAANKPNDDPTMIIMLDRVIWCILLCGGLHLKCLHFFVTLRTYFKLKFDFGPFHIFSQYPYQNIPGDEKLKFYHNGWEIVSYLYNLWNSILTKDDKVDCWSGGKARQLLMPQVFDAGNMLLVMEGTYFNLYFSSFEQRRFEVTPQMYCKPILKSQIRMPEYLIQERTSKSIELLKLWDKLYYGDPIPELVASLDYPS